MLLFKKRSQARVKTEWNKLLTIKTPIMTTTNFFNKEETKKLLKDFCESNELNYNMTKAVIFYKYLDTQEYILATAQFIYWIAGKFNIPAHTIEFESIV
jgi:hypothetical protein